MKLDVRDLEEDEALTEDLYEILQDVSISVLLCTCDCAHYILTSNIVAAQIVKPQISYSTCVINNFRHFPHIIITNTDTCLFGHSHSTFLREVIHDVMHSTEPMFGQRCPRSKSVNLCRTSSVSRHAVRDQD